MFFPHNNPVEGQLHVPECTASVTDIERMRQALIQDPEALNRPQQSSKYVPFLVFKRLHTPLHDAALVHHKECVQFLLDAGADPSAICEENKESPIMTAMTNFFNNTMGECFELVELLLRAGASPNVTWDEYSPRTSILNRAIQYRLNKVVRLLLEYGAESDELIRNENGEMESVPGQTPFTCAINYVNSVAMLLLLFHGCNFKLINYKFCKNMIFQNSEMQSIPHFLVHLIKKCILDNPVTYFAYLETSKEKMIENAIKVLSIYRLGGGNLWMKEKDPDALGEAPKENILELFKRRPELETLLAPLPRTLMLLMDKPLTLTELCRVTIQNSIGKNYFRSTHDLQLPKSLADFLLFK